MMKRICCGALALLASGTIAAAQRWKVADDATIVVFAPGAGSGENVEFYNDGPDKTITIQATSDGVLVGSGGETAEIFPEAADHIFVKRL